MTEIYNQKATIQLITSALQNRYRAQAAILFIDIDNFKLVNDTLGHQRGDEVICCIGHLLSKIAGKNGIAGRIGGDEFLLFLPILQDMKLIRQSADNICDALKQHPELELGNLPISCSVGISVYPQDGTNYEVLLHKADQAMYDAKRHGKRQYGFYSESL